MFMLDINNYNYNGKNLKSPLTYNKLKGIMFFLPISYSRASDIISGLEVVPIRILPQKALLGLTVFDFIDSPVGPYRELALTIPVALNNLYKPNIIPLLFPKALSKHFALYTIMLGMNTLHGQKHASEIFGYPVYKNLLDIDFNFDGGVVSVKIKDNGSDVLIFKNNVNKNFKEHERVYQTIFRVGEDTRLVDLSASTVESATYMDRLNNLQLGKSSIANKINNLEPSMFSLQTSFYKNAIETLTKSENI